MRKIVTLVASAAMAFGVLGATSGAASAATIVCNVDGVVVCAPVSGAKPLALTSTSVNATPEPATLNSTITITGKVRTLMASASGNNHGSARIYFQRVGSSASVYLGTVAVNNYGNFSFRAKALHSGSFWARYSGNKSSSTVNGRGASTSNKDFVQVLRFGAKTTVVAESSPLRRTTYTTSYRAADPARNVIVRYSLNCSAPVGNFQVQTIGGSSGSVRTANLNSGRTVLSGSVSLDVVDYATAIRVRTPNAACAVSISAYQQRVTQVN